MMEVDEIAVAADLWRRAVAGDAAAKCEIRTAIDGLTIYEHLLVLPGAPSDYEFVTAGGYRSQLDQCYGSWVFPTRIHAERFVKIAIEAAHNIGTETAAPTKGTT